MTQGNYPMFLFITELPADQFKYWVDVLAASSSVFTAFIAFVSIAIALFSLREARKQRESSYQPDLFFSFPNTMKTQITNFQNGYRDVECIVFDEEMKKSKVQGIPHTIENIGLGSAKDVHIQWTFDFKKAYDVIEKAVKKPTQISILNDSDLNLSDTNGNELIGTTNKYIDNSVKYDFVLPRKDERFTKTPVIPQEIHAVFAIMFLVRHKVFDREKLDQLYTEEYKRFPPLIAYLTYSDIAEKSYSKKFRVKLSSGLYLFQDEDIDLNKIKNLEFILHVTSEVIE
jgi:hypothetical protein